MDQFGSGAPQSLIGKKLGHYEIVDQLGEGGMGVVYKARDTHLDRFVALKTLQPAVLADPDRRRRFVREAKAASALNHPNIVHVYDISHQDGVDFIVMEYIVGSSLHQWVRDKRPARRELLDCAIQISDGLEVAHKPAIVHPDLN